MHFAIWLHIGFDAIAFDIAGESRFLQALDRVGIHRDPNLLLGSVTDDEDAVLLCREDEPSNPLAFVALARRHRRAGPRMHHGRIGPIRSRILLFCGVWLFRTAEI